MSNQNEPTTGAANARTRRRIIVLVAIGLLAIPVSLVGYRRLSGNLGVVEPGRVYRSAQLSSGQLRDVIARHQIRTVLNLRGANPDQAWYRDELAATLAGGAQQIDLPLASDQWLSHEQIETLLRVADEAAYPLLLHCEFGAERTGLVSALLTLLRPGSTLDQADDQFSPAYLFVAMKDGVTMKGHLDAYKSWLASSGRSRSPETLRDWLKNAYQPGEESREHWPCNPYPRRVVTTRGSDGRDETWVEWSTNACPKTVATGSSERSTRK